MIIIALYILFFIAFTSIAGHYLNFYKHYDTLEAQSKVFQGAIIALRAAVACRVPASGAGELF